MNREEIAISLYEHFLCAWYASKQAKPEYTVKDYKNKESQQ